MKIPKVIGGVLVIGFFVFILLVIFGNYIGSATETNVGGRKKESAVLGNSPKNVPKLERVADLRPVDLQASAASAKKERLVADDATRKMGEKIARSLADLNSGGLVKVNNKRFAKALNPQRIVNEVLRQELEEIEQLSGINNEPPVKISSSKIIAGANKKAKENYLNDFWRILKDSETAIAALKISLPADLNQIAEVYEKAAVKLQILEVPAELAPLHKKGIALLLKKGLIWRKLAKSERLPLEAAAALREYEQTRRDAKIFEQLVSNYIRANELTVKWQ